MSRITLTLTRNRNIKDGYFGITIKNTSTIGIDLSNMKVISFKLVGEMGVEPTRFQGG